MIAYTPFIQPAPVWDYWAWLLIPLVIGVSIVYKTIRCKTLREVPREAATITFWILASLAAAGALLAAVVKILE